MKWIALMLTTSLFVFAVTSANAQPATSNSAAPILFRKEFVPSSLLSREAKGLIPIKRTELQELLDAAASPQGVPADDASIEEVQWFAELHEGRLRGKAEVHVHYTGKGPKFVSLDGLKTSIKNPTWKSATHGTPKLGCGPDGKLYIVVSESDVLTFDWTLPAKRDPWGGLSFDLQSCAASRTRIFLPLKVDLQLESSSGVVQSSIAEISKPTEWQIELGGTRETVLRIADQAVRRPAVMVREDTEVSLQEGSMDVACQLRLDVFREPVKRLTIRTAGPWIPHDIALGDREVPFDVQPAGKGHNFELHFDPPVAGTNRRITMSGRSAIKLGERLEFPRPQIEDATWLEGSVRIRSPRELTLMDWQNDGLKLKPSNGPRDESADTLTWQSLKPNCSLAATPTRRDIAMLVESGTTLQISEQVIAARMVSDFKPSGEGTYSLQAEISPTWVVDSVDCALPDYVERWELTEKEGRRSIDIRLAKSLVPDVSTRFTIHAHRPPPAPQELLTGKRLRPLVWQASSSRGIVALSVAARWNARLDRDRFAKRLSPGDLSEAQSQRVNLAEEAILIEDDDGLSDARLELVEEKPRFTVQWNLAVTIESDQVAQVATARVLPESSPIEQLVVSLKGVGADSTRWSVPGEPETSVSAQRTNLETAEDGEQIWELYFSRPRRNPFTLEATLADRSGPDHDIAIANCLDAASQSGTIRVNFVGQRSLAVNRAEGCSPVLLDEASHSEAWTYDPYHRARLSLRSVSGAEQTQLLSVQKLTLVSRLAGEELLHDLSFHVQNQQLNRFEATLPPTAIFTNAWVDGRAVVATLSPAKILSIPLSPNKSAATVRIAYITPAISTWIGLDASPAWPELKPEPVQREWQMITPESFRCLTTTSQSQPATPATIWNRIRGSVPGLSGRGEPPTIEPIGCRTLSFASDESIPNKLEFASIERMEAWAWLAFAIGFYCVRSMRYKSRIAVSMSAFVFGAIALSVPHGFDPIGRMLFWGTLLGMVSRAWAYQPSFPLNRTSSAGPSGLLRPEAIIIGGAVVMALSVSNAQDKVREKPLIHRIIYPIDEKGQPQGDYVYLSETLYDQLVARATRPSVGQQPWLVSRVRYTGQPNEGSTQLAEIEADVELETFSPQTIVPITWKQSNGSILANAIRLDGRIVAGSFNDGGDTVSLIVSMPGTHRLTFRADAIPADKLLMQQTLALLPSAESTLDIASSVVPSKVRVAPVWTSSRDANGVTHAELDRLSQTTISIEPSLATPVAPNVEQLLWARNWRGASLVETRLKFTSNGSSLTSMSIDTDAQLELLSSAAEVPMTVTIEPSAIGRLITWTSELPINEATVEAMFVWRPSNTHQRILPRIEPVDAVVKRRWLALDVSEESGLNVVPAKDGVVDIDRFASTWNADVLPRVTLELDGPGPMLIAASPLTGGASATLSTILKVDRDVLDWETTVQANADALSNEMQVFSVPEASSVTSAELMVAGQRQNLKWLSLAGDRIGVQLEQPLQDGHSIVLRGRVPVEIDQLMRFAVPVFHSGNVTQHAIDFQRHPHVFLNIMSLPSNAKHSSSIPSTNAPWLLIDRIAFTPEADEIPIEFKVTPNRLRFVGMSLTSSKRDATSWRCRYDLVVSARDGSLDMIRLAVPKSWSDVRILDSSSNAPAVNLTDGGRQLQVIPSVPVTGRWKVSLEGNIVVGTNQRLQVPSIRLEDAEAIESYVSVPDEPQVRWLSLGLQPSELPAVLSSDETGRTYRVERNDFELKLEGEARDVANPYALYAEYGVEAMRSRANIANAVFVVAPATMSRMPLELPAGCELRRALVLGKTVICQKLSATRWLVPLRSSNLAQIVRVEYDAPPSALDPSLVPNIAPWKVEQSIHADEQLTPQVAVNRLKAITLATEQSLTNRAALEAERAAWASSWSPILADASDKVADDRGLVEVMQKQLQRARQLQEELTRIKVDDHASGSNSNVRSVWKRDADSMLVETQDSTSTVDAIWTRWLVPTAIWGLLVALGYRVTCLPIATELACRWPFAALSLVCIAISLLVSPLWVGGALIAITAAASFVWPWKPRQHPGLRAN